MTGLREHLTAAEREQVGAVVRAAGLADGVSPVNESASLIIAGKREGSFLLHHDGGTVDGFAVADPRESTIQLAVTPQRRGAGIGAELLAGMLGRHPRYSVWAFHTLPAARALAAASGLVAHRELLRLGRPLAAEPGPRVPAGYTIAPYTADDAAAVVAVNRLAFSHHPEQGKLTLDEFTTLTEQDWFDPDGLLLARAGGEVAGFHWTKRHGEDLGEVYVLAVHPDHEGAGLGRALLEAGLAHLEALGCDFVHLYVEASEARVVQLYEAAQFGRLSVDTSFRVTE